MLIHAQKYALSQFFSKLVKKECLIAGYPAPLWVLTQCKLERDGKRETRDDVIGSRRWEIK